MSRFICSGRMLGGTAILLSTIIVLIVFVNPPQTRILHSSSPQTASPTHNSSSPWNPSDVRCSGLPDTSHIQVVVKTGTNIIYDKLPTQLLTALRCCQDPLIFADSEQDIGPYHVYDVLANVNETLKATHPDFAYYRTIKDYLSSGRDIRLLRTSRQAAWDLDKYKFIHMLVETWERRPGHDWYVFVEADTYLFWGNLVQWLARMDPAKPLYLGSAATFQNEKFAHGGSGVILSREAMKRVLDGDADLAARYDERMHDEIYGDYVLMKALKEKGVELSNKWPMMQGEKQNTLPFGPGPNTGSRHGCQPLITMHSVTPVDVNAMWNYEQRRKHPQEPLLIGELYDYFMGRALPSQRDDWYNLSDDLMFRAPGVEGQRQKSPADMTPVEKEAYSSFEQYVYRRGCIDLNNERVIPLSQLTPNVSETICDKQDTTAAPETNQDDHGSRPLKRRKTVSGLRLAPHNQDAAVTGTESQVDGCAAPDSNGMTDDAQKSSVRQVHSDTRFPQRKNPSKDTSVPVLEPTSTDKLIAGIWRQVFSPVQLSRFHSVFRAVNTLCLKYYNQSQSSRALEMIVQAYWIECYEARIAVLRLENPNLSAMEIRMMGLREACAVLNWKEKDLRNRIAIWRGYKEIKDAGGWASLIFASAGVYRFCKYRTGFGEGFSTRLRHIRSSLEVAADTLHPDWRDLLQVIGQQETRQYHGHPHEWVTVTGRPAVPLTSTYEHLQLPNGFHYRFIDECVLDTAAFGTEDPRRVPEIDPDVCLVCKERQSDEIEKNHCSCFPTLFGGVRNPVPVQLFHTTSGKNNGVIARSNFDRGIAIGEFTGLITKGIEGVDVMLGGTRTRTYQVFQGQMGNFTRFINHSCRPNSQFQRFYWRGKERIIVVSRGVTAGSEITVDYSDHYWKQLNKICLCGEPCCRFRERR
ncbi:hypothetical protein BDV33DRAFT_189028 [Aspergillus novoparasiticus]|uniref:N-acetylgalactosaminide beta-1,3-galactosyltransferase n=1 Tax=Aspergillus novoparasiticus TaxID=986946 RepID=A0A5N6F2I0_9EURO|nr:hypothetical protein BDV33DRAFT_189028 [Aspergillus novoparasiticus]